MEYLCIDLWDKRVGIAYNHGPIAFPLEIITRTNLISYIKKYIKEKPELHHIIVGLPYDLYGKDTKQLEKTQKFIEKLRDIFPDKEVIGHDERFSSFEASRDFGDHRDDIAAQCILQSYIDSIS